LAAKPIAAPARAALMIGPAPSPHEKALRFSRPLLRWRLSLSPLLRLDELRLAVRLDWRLWVRVAIDFLLR
jgi:hypothetical protein